MILYTEFTRRLSYVYINKMLRVKIIIIFLSGKDLVSLVLGNMCSTLSTKLLELCRDCSSFVYF